MSSPNHISKCHKQHLSTSLPFYPFKQLTQENTFRWIQSIISGRNPSKHYRGNRIKLNLISWLWLKLENYLDFLIIYITCKKKKKIKRLKWKRQWFTEYNLQTSIKVLYFISNGRIWDWLFINILVGSTEW